jgi:ppGpp synthetase/RelA/SpoT-type nucleotidyltranferase
MDTSTRSTDSKVVGERSAATQRYKEERPHYLLLANKMRELISSALKKAGIPCRVEARAKDVHSFVGKLIRAPQPYDEVYDKAGIRIVPHYTDDRARVADVARATFDITWERDSAQVTEATSSSFAYRGLHMTARLRNEDRALVAAEAATLCAEVQIHTLGESMWATVCHDLAYKPGQQVPLETKRSLSRMSALLELVDLELAAARRSILSQPGATEANVIATLEKHFLQFSVHGSDVGLSREVVKSLLPILPPHQELSEKLDAFVAAKHPLLEHVYNEYRDDDRHLLLSQPESILMLYLLDTDPNGLEANLWEGLPTDTVNGLQGVWVED